MTKKILCFVAILFSILLFYNLSFAQSSPIFGPKKYIREKGKPEEVKETFSVCALQGVYKLIVENGLYTEAKDEEDKGDEDEKDEKKKTKVSAGEIEINGEEIIEEGDFNKKVTRIERSILLPQGENQMEIEVEGEPGAYITVTIECASGCLEPKIISPATNSIINKSKTIIQGNLTNLYGEAGVTIQSSGASGQVIGLAQTQGNSFAGIIPLQQGQNTIIAQATDACGYKATDTITINTETIQELIKLTAIPNSGIPKLEVSLQAEINTPNPINTYQWDLDGNGSIDLSGNYPEIINAYLAPGLYFPKVIITDSEGNTYAETTIVNVLSKEEMDALLKGKWDGMKEKLLDRDIKKALQYFSENSRERYNGIFTSLQDRLVNIIAEMREIQLIYLENGIAKYRIRRLENVAEITYYIYFELNENGIWKLKQF